MAEHGPESQRLDGGGTSQAARVLAALDPDFVKVDERTAGDLFEFARLYAHELEYFDDENTRAGVWDGFLDPRPERADVEAFLDSPAGPLGEGSGLLARPHVSLFLAFLALLRRAQDDVNRLTRRHLEFYYRTVLKLAKKAPVADRVNVLLEPAPDVDEVLVPEGTLLDGGVDSGGTPQVYRTDRNIVVSRARVERLSAVYVEKRVTGIREARERPVGADEERFLRMFETALGHPDPGNPLPPYPTGEVVDVALLARLHATVHFCVDRQGLAMELFELDRLVPRLRKRVAGAEWNEINAVLQAVGRTRDAGFTLTAADRDFDESFLAALGGKPDYDGLTLVENVDDVYHQRFRDEVRDFIEADLGFPSADDFERIMKLKLVVEAEWKEINRTLELAGRRRRGSSTYTLAAADPSDFERNLNDALPDLTLPDGIADIAAYYDAISQLEAFFFMSAEDFLFVTSLLDRSPAPQKTEWSRAYDILAGAHAKKVYAARRRRIEELRESLATKPLLEQFDALVHFALGESAETAEPAPLGRLAPFVSNEGDSAVLAKTRAKLSDNTGVPVDWERVVRILELAQRNREGLPTPVAVTEEWLNLHPFADVTQVISPAMTGEEGELVRWRTFGQRPLETEESVPAPSIGWAISSPLLALAEGERTIRLDLSLAPGSFAADRLRELFPLEPSDPPAAPTASDPFRIEVSTEEGWVEPEAVSVAVESGEPTALTFLLEFGVEVAPIVAASAADGRIGPTEPTLRLMLRQTWDATEGAYRTRYPDLRHLAVSQIELGVTVRGITSPRIQNDDGPLDPKNPFEPFGATPAVGSRFYVTHPELLGKPVRTVDFQVEWMGVPPDLELISKKKGTVKKKGYYANYSNRAPFEVRLGAYDDRLELELEPSVRLFDGTSASAARTLSVKTDALAERAVSWEPRAAAADEDEESDLRKWRRCLTWELTPRDFHHAEYPRLAASKATALAAAIGAGETVTVADYQVNPPYTPRIARIALDYTASVTIDATSTAGFRGRERIHHVHPFGYERLRPGAVGGLRFLPRYDDEGELYVGIAGFDPEPGTTRRLSILFQMAEGSADPALSPEPIRWSRLDGDRWVPLEDGHVLLDTTRGFINSGIVELNLVGGEPAARLGSELYWIRASIRHSALGVCDTVAVHAQAVSATFVDDGNAPDHYDQPLPAGTIADLVQRIPDVGGISQPYTSFGGKTEEHDSVFHTRVSERLRHKGRALTTWDYERLVLERFPEIYKAKCIPGGALDDSVAPGHVDVIVIPDVRNRRPFDPFEPKVPADVIADVEAYLAARAPFHADVHVRNPRYVPIRARLGVRFKETGNDGFYKRRLNEELSRFLSPWAYDEGADIVIGGRIYANNIIDFLDRRPYVDFISHLLLFTSEDGHTFRLARPSKTEGFFVTTSLPDGVLVAARQHEIDVISEKGAEEESFLGVGYMRVELDFDVAGDDV